MSLGKKILQNGTSHFFRYFVPDLFLKFLLRIFESTVQRWALLKERTAFMRYWQTSRKHYFLISNDFRFANNMKLFSGITIDSKDYFSKTQQIRFDWNLQKYIFYL